MPPETPAFSIILPAYNEAARLPPYLAKVRRHLDIRYPDCYEVIVVDDGSDDGLIAALEGLARDWPQLRWIRLPQNQGKGAAVRAGMLAGRGELLLFADADGATPIEEECRLSDAIQAGADLAVGSRLMVGSDAQRLRHPLRGLAGRVFAALARWLLGLSVHDPQCGFKMFRGEVGRKLFSMVIETRYLFDLEVLTLAGRHGWRLVEVPVHWTEVPGGHLHLGRELPNILLNLWRLRRRLHP